MRKSFEKWLQARYMSPHSDFDLTLVGEHYKDKIVQIAWEAWQAGYNFDLQGESA